MNNFYVYMYLRSHASVNGGVGTPYYVGKGKGKRAYKNQHRTAPRPKDKRNIIFLGKQMAEVDAFQAEMLLVHLYGRIDLGTGCLRNLTDGGEGMSGNPVPQERRERISKALQGHTFSASTKKKISATLRKAFLDPEFKNRIVEAANKHRPRGENHHAFGRERSAETRRKISEGNLGKPAWNKGKALSDSHREALKGSWKHRPPMSEETRARLSVTTRAYWERKRLETVNAHI